jgi:hypothetical protein
VEVAPQPSQPSRPARIPGGRRPRNGVSSHLE